MDKKRRIRRILGTGLVAAWVLDLAGPVPRAAAQTAPGSESDLQEIVVTARKRAESILDVPVSISATTAGQLEQKGLKNLEDLARTVPGLVVQQGSEQSSKTFVVRGIGAVENAATVAVYIDDTPVTFGPDSPDLNVFDIARVEVLRGPQGTLFGASSMGGAVRYVTPDVAMDGFEGSGKVEAGLIRRGGETYEVQAVTSGPVVAERLGVRASAFYRRDGGYIDRVDEATGVVVDADTNSMDSYGGRLAFRLLPADGIEADLSLLYQEQEQNDYSRYFAGRGVANPVPLKQFQKVARIPAYRNERFLLPNLTVTAGLGGAELTSSTSYVDRDAEFGNDFSYFIERALGLPETAGLIAANAQTNSFKAVIQELRLASTGEGPLRWLVGGYFQDSERRAPQLVTTPNLATIVPPLQDAILPGGVLFVRSPKTETRQLAAFGEATYTLAEAVELTAGLRATDVDFEFTRSADGLFNGGPSGDRAKGGEKPVTPKFSASYAFETGGMVYATAAKGFREGGSNVSVPTNTPACAAALAALGRTDVPGTFKSDTLWSYEVGAKTQTRDRRLRVQGAVYQIDWSGIQQVINLAGGCGNSYTDNVGKARSRGFELEASWVPVDHVTVDITAGYTDAELEKDLISGATATGPIVAAPKGTTLANVPDWTFSIGGQYDFTLGDRASYVRADLQHVGRIKRHLNTPSDDPRSLDQDSYRVVSLRAGTEVGGYEVAVFVNNLLDEDVIINEAYGEFAPGDWSARTSIRPRMVGVSVAASF